MTNTVYFLEGRIYGYDDVWELDKFADVNIVHDAVTFKMDDLEKLLSAVADDARSATLTEADRQF